MNRWILIMTTMGVLLVGCKKDDTPPDLSYLCDNGGIWLVDKKDSFNPNALVDTFLFNQAGGYHRFVFTNSGVNRLQVDVLTKPDSGQTFIYKSMFVREISGTYIAEKFSYTSMKDSVLTIRNNGSHYLLSIQPIEVNISTSRTIGLRACDLKMNDVNP